LHFPEYELYWTIISILLVISPEEKDAKKLTYDRFKANLIGSSVGLICYLFPVSEMLMMLLGIMIAIAICHFFKLMTVARTAIVALIIVVIHEQETMTYWAAVERFLSVTGGCFIGLLVTMGSSPVIQYLRHKTNLE
jgi:uncharacterized membrane protein YgaE (UPF0421/DUF939 family)